MSKRTLLLLVAAVIAAFTALSVKSRLSQTPPTPTVQGTRILVAKHELSPGSFVQPGDLDWGQPPAAPVIAKPPAEGEEATDNASVPVPGNEAKPVVQEPYLYEGSTKVTDYNGAVVRRLLHEGDPVTASAVMKAGSGGLLSAVLNPGMRAVSVGIAQNANAAPFVSGFVLPGDYVDLIVTREITRQISNGREQESRKIVFSKIFVQNVRVLAVDQSLDNPENKAIVAKTVTVEVTPTQAQEVAVAAELGKISLSLRSAVKMGSAAQEKAEAAALAGSNVSDTDIAGEKTPDVSEQVKMFRPKETQNLEFYRTGR
jgi:pilus assembly protein CpaB